MNKYMSYDDVLKLKLGDRLFSESKRERYQVVYNLGKVIVKRVRYDGKLEKRTQELTKQEVESNFYH